MVLSLIKWSAEMLKQTPDFFSIQTKHGAVVASMFQTHSCGYSVAVNARSKRSTLAKVLSFYRKNWSLTKRLNKKQHLNKLSCPK